MDSMPAISDASYPEDLFANGNTGEQSEVGDRMSGSETESIPEAIEAVFGSTDKPRRKASLASYGQQGASTRRQKTSCFVHTLLEERRSASHWTPSNEGVAQDRTAEKNNGTPNNHEPHTQSRLLTKAQLSDMAFGIRELSKKLGHIRLVLEVRNVFLLTKAHDQTLIHKTRQMAEWLLQQKLEDNPHPYTVWVENTLKHNKGFDAEGLVSQDPTAEHRLKFWTNELCAKKPNTFDICVALGGDGTVLYSSWLFQRVVPPVMSFALGSLGFLTKFDFDNFEQILTRAFSEGITASLRLRFEATIMRSNRRCEGDEEEKSRDLIEELIRCESEDVSTHHPESSHNILNDIVLDRGPNPTMSSIELFGDEEHFTTVQADGVCVATPTGSTAYNLAAGGSLCHPDNPVICVTAIAPHTLSFRPIILPDTMVLRIGVAYDARASSWASFDGKERKELRPGDYVTISASRYPFPSVLPLDRRSEDWIESISRTLNWNNRQRQKAFHEAKKDGEEE